MVDLTNGAIINHRVTTKACASVSKQGVAVATNDTQLALARGLDSLVAAVVFSKRTWGTMAIDAMLTLVCVAGVRIQCASSVETVRIKKILQAHEKVAVCLAQWGRRKAVLKLATGYNNQVDIAVRAYSKVQHVAGLVRLYCSGTVSVGRLRVSALLREYVDGPTLREAHGVDLRELESRLKNILDDIHRCGIVHRDVKPDNLVLEPDRKQCIPRIFDLGCAGDIGGPAGMGTKGFRSSNASRGSVARTSDDWYSLERTLEAVRSPVIQVEL